MLISKLNNVIALRPVTLQKGHIFINFDTDFSILKVNGFQLVHQFIILLNLLLNPGSKRLALVRFLRKQVFQKKGVNGPVIGAYLRNHMNRHQIQIVSLLRPVS
ncbi:hypothetical protein D3C74_372090 [compost metagenome]